MAQTIAEIEDRSVISPMMQKYLETKEQYKDCILFYRLGDFYEMFFDDAITASRELELTLTGRTDSNKVVIFEGDSELKDKIIKLKIVSEHMWYLKGER